MTPPARSTSPATEPADLTDPDDVGFEPDATPARQLPDGHADARSAVRPGEFDPPAPRSGRGSSTDQPGTDQPGTDQPGTDQPDGGPVGTDQAGTGRNDRGRRSGGDRSVSDQAGGDRTGGADVRGARAGRGGVPALVVRSWRQLTSMRTALLLLFLLALAAVPGSLLPQRNINPMRVEQYLNDHPALGPLLDRFSGFNVFAAPWFAAIYLLLFISLIGCLSSRVRWHARALFTAPPKAPTWPGRLPGGSAWASPLPPAEAATAARAALRGRRFRASSPAPGALRPDGSPDHSVAAEKGYLRETGNLLFHVALVGLLAAVGFGSWFGYTATTLVVSGGGFANTVVSYDQFTAGHLVDTARLRPFSLTLDRFKATYQPDGVPADFHADVTYADDLDAPTQPATVKVNRPLAIGDTKVYLIGHGYAPHFILRDARGGIVWQGNVPCTPRDGMFTSTCTVKIPDTGLAPVGTRREPQQLAFSGVFTPTTRLDPANGYVSIFPAATAPGLTITGFVGNLHLDEGVPQNVYTVDTRDMRQLTLTGPAGQGRTAQVLALNNPAQRTLTGLPGGLSLEADAVAEFATFQVKSDPFKREALIFAVLIIVGLIASLRVRRRRVWVRARPGATGGSEVEIGGLSRSHGDGFAAELAVLTTLVRTATAGDDGSTPNQPRGTAAGNATRKPSEREH